MKNVHGATYLLNIDGRYYFRRPVPPDVREAFDGKAIIKVALRTDDKERAKVLLAKLKSETDDAIEDARRRLQPHRRDTLTKDEARQLARLFSAKLLGRDEDARIDGDPDHLEHLGDRYSALDEALQGHHNSHAVRKEAHAFLEEQGVVVPPKSEAMKTLLYYIRAELRDALDGIAERVKGRDVATPKVDPKIAPLLLSQLFTLWERERKPRPKLKDEYDRSRRLFTELHGDLPLASITKDHIIAVKDELVRRDKASATVVKTLTGLKVLFKYAVGNNKIAANPAEGVNVASKRPRITPRPFRVAELQTLFAHPVFTKGVRTRGSAGEAMFWLPLMALYSGARLEELGQLRVSDFEEVPALGWRFHIHEYDEGNSVKTGEPRFVPVHAELARLGFLKYVEQRRKAGAFAWLFPELPERTAQGRGRTRAITKRLNDLIDAVGLDDPTLRFHSTRHTFIAFARVSGIEGRVRRRISGHETGDTHDNYGGTDEEVYRAMAQYSVPGLSLSSVKRVG